MKNEEYENESQCEDIEDYGVDGYHPVYLGERFNGAYQVIQKLGWGNFSTVWLVQSLANPDQYFALKIQRSKPTHAETAIDQLNLLKTLMAHEKDSAWQEQLKTKFGLSFTNVDMLNVYRPLLLIDNFAHYGMSGKHYCSVFELMGPNLLDLIQHYEYKDIQMPLWLVKRITVDVLVGMVFLHQHCKMIHTDIKPENIMVKLPEGIQKNLVESIREYKKKPISMKYLNKLVANNSEKNKKKYDKKKLKKKAAKTGDKMEDSADILGPQAKQETNTDTVSNTNTIQPSQQQPENCVTNQSPSQNYENPVTQTALPLEAGTTQSHQVDPSKPQQIEERVHQNHFEGQKLFSEQSKQTLEWKKLHINIDDKLHFKIADFGNATMSNQHFTQEIQTREYRAPEAIVGLQYLDNTDVWSLACMVYQLMTNTFLFKPKSRGNISKDQDHLYKMIELLGPMPKVMTSEGTQSRKMFNKKGDLMNGNPTTPLSISQLLVEDFKYSVEEANLAQDFLLPMLEYAPSKRISAYNCLHSKWLWS